MTVPFESAQPFGTPSIARFLCRMLRGENLIAICFLCVCGCSECVKYVSGHFRFDTIRSSVRAEEADWSADKSVVKSFDTREQYQTIKQFYDPSGSSRRATILPTLVCSDYCDAGVAR